MKNILTLCFSLISVISVAENVDIMDFGAVPDGITLSTEPIQKAIDHCSATGGGTVMVPPGTYLTHTLFLRSGVNLHISKAAVILGDKNPEAFTQAVIYADRIKDASISGLGVINGQGFAKDFPKTGKRHNDVRFYRCKNIRINDVTIINSPTWVLRILECDGVIIRGVRIFSYVNQNNDGIDIDAKNVILSDCIIDSEDDAICLKSDNPDFLVENVTITNCIIGTNCNAIKFGTASHCGFKNIAISNCAIRWPKGAAKIPPRSTLKGCDKDTIMEVGIALEIVDGGFMDQVTISNITMTGIQTPLFIRLGNRRSQVKDANGNPVPGSLKNVLISNITATDETMLNSSVTAVPGSYVENVIIRDIIFTSKGTGTMLEAMADVPEKISSYPQTNVIFGYSIPAYGMYMRHVSDLVLDNFIFNLRSPDARPPVVLDDCHNIWLSNFSVDKPTDNQPLVRLMESTNVTVSGYQSLEPVDNFILLEGEKTRDIKLTGNDFTRVGEIARLKNGARESSLKMMSNFLKSSSPAQ